MKILELIRDFEITFSGGVAVYALLCMCIVIVSGISQIFNWMFNQLL